MLPSHRAEHRVERASAKTAKTALILCAAALSCAVLFDGLSVRHTAVSNIDLAVHLGGDGDTGARALTSATLTNPSRIFGARLGSLRCDIHGAPDDAKTLARLESACPPHMPHTPPPHPTGLSLSYS